MKITGASFRIFVAFLLILFATTWCQAQVVILHSFSGAPDGQDPAAGLIQGTDGNFYGTTEAGGTGSPSAAGAVYQMTPGGSVTVIHSFSSTPDGQSPMSEVLQGSDGFLYGTTHQGGGNAFGIIFKMSTSGATTILHQFPDSLVPGDGIAPSGDLLAGFAGFDGVTESGGSNGGSGTIYNFEPSGAFHIIHSFSFADGASPRGGLATDPQGNLFGTAAAGGANHQGTFFEVSTTGGTTSFSVLHNFGDQPTDGTDPEGQLVRYSDGNFYGTTRTGGTDGGGTVFKVTPNGSITILHSFANTPTNGYIPLAGLIQAKDGNFYGTTQVGGAGLAPIGGSAGTVFSISPSGVFNIIHSFCDGSVANDGAYPQCRLYQASDGNLYGTTLEGGASNMGTVFEVLMGYPGWVAKYNLTGANALPTATLQPDGLANILKYSLGLDPTVNYNPGSAGLPVVQIQNFSGSNFLTLTFNGVAFDVHYIVQASTDLSTWETIQTFNGVTNGPVTVQDVGDVSTLPKRFMRLQVTYP